MNRRTALRLVKDELDRAIAEHPKFNSCHEGYAVLHEETDELWDEVKANEGNSDRGVSEAVQVAAMALRYLMDLCPEEVAEDHEEKVKAHYAKTKTPPPRPSHTYIPLSDTEMFGGGYSG